MNRKRNNYKYKRLVKNYCYNKNVKYKKSNNKLNFVIIVQYKNKLTIFLHYFVFLSCEKENCTILKNYST